MSQDPRQPPPEPGAAPSPRLPEGTVLEGRYRLGRALGEGGFGAVYEAWHLAMGVTVAVKVLLVTDPQARQRFLREAQAAARIGHPGIVTVHDYGIDADGRPFLVMERLVGHDLSQELRQHGPLAPRRAVALTSQVLEALGAAHHAGVVHKDLKPSNLFLLDRGGRLERVCVLDFGIARFGDEEGEQTRTGQPVGTARYLAPEYLERNEVTPAVDVYQMGLILAELLTGVPVVQASSWWGAASAHLQGQVTLPAHLLGGPLGPVLLRATARDPAGRYSNGWEMLDALAALDLAALERAMPAPTPARVGDGPGSLGHEDTAPPEVRDWAIDLYRPPEAPSAPTPLPEGCALIPAGRFLMGSPPDEPGRSGDERQREVTLGRPLVVWRAPVTTALWEALMDTPAPSAFEGPQRPLEQVSWFDAVALCNRLSQRDGLPPFYRLEGVEGAPGLGLRCARVISAPASAPGWRLPTEAEWEYFARAGSAGAFGVEAEALGEVAWHRANAGGTSQPVGLKAPNAWGLHDTLGNVAEWVHDRYGNPPDGPAVDPREDDERGGLRVIRGGSWRSLPGDCRLAARRSAQATERHRTVGLRPVRTWEQEEG